MSRVVEHAYGPRVTILDNPWMHSALARIGQEGTSHTELMALLRTAYSGLAQFAMGQHLPTVHSKEPTRMAAQHGELGYWQGRALDPATQVVVLDVIRGGIVPAQVCFELLTAVLPIANLRLDHLNMSRIAGGDGRVSRVDLSGSKIGGTLEGVTLVVPDPMGATGSTLIRAIEYLSEHHGQPAQILALPLIATPEFIQRTLPAHADLSIVCGRLDRGLSPPDVLDSPPGTYPERERGLDDQDYIVPGAGGVGEVLNNSWC